MHLTYVLLSPTFGMHQYTADLANRASGWERGAGEWGNEERIHLVTTTTLPRDRYSPAVQIQTPVTTRGTGFAREGFDLRAYRRAHAAISNLQPFDRLRAGSATCNLQPGIVHFTGVHLWNVPLVYALRRRGVPVIHTLHDLEPHHGVRFGGLIRLWNRLIVASGCHLLVHGRRYREQLLAAGVPAERVTVAPLLHGFLSAASAARPWPPLLNDADSDGGISFPGSPVVFFGRVEAYKGIDTLLAAWGQLGGVSGGIPGAPRLIIAGPVADDVTLLPLPPGVELRNRRIFDDEGDALFRSAGLLVLPYRDATQSALVAAAYAYGVPVVVSDSGALGEYVVPGETGWVVPPGDTAALASALREALVDHPGRLATMGAAGRRWFEAQRRMEEETLARMYTGL